MIASWRRSSDPPLTIILWVSPFESTIFTILGWLTPDDAIDTAGSTRATCTASLVSVRLGGGSWSCGNRSIHQDPVASFLNDRFLVPRTRSLARPTQLVLISSTALTMTACLRDMAPNWSRISLATWLRNRINSLFISVVPFTMNLSRYSTCSGLSRQILRISWRSMEPNRSSVSVNREVSWFNHGMNLSEEISNKLSEMSTSGFSSHSPHSRSISLDSVDTLDRTERM
ncbi:hypothetical protein OGAPHI_002176 [Ogataea philodendri]|uniref:Uncharacterized protein n=1 Tax=Ogataea philodendri TaxID=1378263 RepID=A0A9P8PAQ8_9ASCO|nr:uncharacterized protein OGAPHI_002176 [Ogataea philodendri]KAH3668422.1 hypothetical protein OGAPHI_002176 [Ogataea philodendri]